MTDALLALIFVALIDTGVQLRRNHNTEFGYRARWWWPFDWPTYFGKEESP